MYAMMDADYFVSCLFFIVALVFINYCENLAVDISYHLVISTDNA